MGLKQVVGLLRDLRRNTQYLYHYYHTPLREKSVLIESKNGGDLAGNMFQILSELLTKKYHDYKVWLVVTKVKKPVIRAMLKKYGLQGVSFVRISSPKYFRLLATVKYLFTDTSFLRLFVKRPGQIITNTWHGTPLKFMGRDVKDRVYAMGNVQRNLVFSDYLVFPNEYMKDIMTEAYQLRSLFHGTMLLEGYPRNSLFCESRKSEGNASGSGRIRTELGLTNQRVYLYMPTWRGTLTKKTSAQLLVSLEYYLLTLDRMLQDNETFYVKLHPFVKQEAEFSHYDHVKPYPDQYDTYEFLNTCDCLVTDYSSVFYDFANTGKKIILFAYDETGYLKERGIYTPLKTLPFPVVKTSANLYKELNLPKAYDDTEFLQRYCTYDAPFAANRICRHVILGEKCCREEQFPDDGKQNVVMYGSAMAKNGITSSMINLFNCIDLSKRNYFVSFQEGLLRKDPLRLNILPREVGVIPISGDVTPTLKELFACHLFHKKNKQSVFVKRYRERLYLRELRRHFGDAGIDVMIQFAGYERKMIDLFEHFPGKKVIFVHNDMIEEMKTRSNQHLLTLINAYQTYTKVAVVTKDIIPPTMKISGREDNIVLVNNCHAYAEIRARAEEPVQFDTDTKSNVTFAELMEILDSNKMKKFITIGRFSPEKGHSMLMKAYERFSREYPDTCLIIIGGHGPLYRDTVTFAKESKANIVVIRSVKNPMPILKRCDFFLLSSLYEGLGLTMLEADTLGLPLVSTNVQGPRGFVNEFGGTLVDVSEEGLYQGMVLFMNGKVKAMNVDYEQYNRHAVQQFEELFD